ncbi:Sec-independent protein translocase subunit TatA/TatB [Fimbriimonas ginsengisoli]|uniref:Sec-independent protein translocase protein TatA n=1 Tax=Fimbriimonas ginsengisoli Gsoil 348 TaxID=661478 RepID=A0A068NZ25_FIMGI|nr:twin-arginine translocase TatA/TatE family subunit [Fimbriimonas ginsengisoli]AIE87834.1 putative Sec-independent protein translocase [Fimbriimonas ginsengisoli Gsoil 348]
MPNLIANIFGVEQWLVILVLALLLFGGKKIPELMRGVGKGVGELQKGLEEGKRQITQSMHEDDSEAKSHEPKETVKRSESDVASSSK